MTKPLEGIRIADFSHVIAGPLATQFLCQLGAEVIKIEPPQGDALRYYTQRAELRGMAEPFISTNAGKKSVVLDLKSEAGQAAAQAIVDRADVLVENFRPGVIKRLGLDAETQQARNPGLIHCSISGYGQQGPMRDFPAIDQIIQSVSGLMGLTGYDEGGGPLRVGFPIVDTYSALLSAFAILAAITQRERDPQNRGQVIDVAMLDAALVMMSSVVTPWMISGIAPERTGNRGFSRAPTADTFETADDPITLGVVQQYQYERLCEAMNRPDLLSDPRFATPDARLDNDTALQDQLTATFRTRGAADWEATLNAAGIPAGIVRSLPQAMDLDQLASRDLFDEVQVPGDAFAGRSAQVLRSGFRFDHDGPEVAGPPPTLGQHTDEVLASLGLAPPKETGH
ncbi:CaiB/BaiF CoA transferase family protein [Oceanicola sp. S124]|uniref:CaiB/BaiF CoA transferase family protein n=1 Tax=Oceanicola sp. S124 TaxID=1042378 RepID=UPI0002557E6D|nr:CoA transferase [Oceanicola sp. S124]